MRCSSADIQFCKIWPDWNKPQFSLQYREGTDHYSQGWRNKRFSIYSTPNHCISLLIPRSTKLFSKSPLFILSVFCFLALFYYLSDLGGPCSKNQVISFHYQPVPMVASVPVSNPHFIHGIFGIRCALCMCKENSQNAWKIKLLLLHV